MQTLTIDIINDKAINLLNDLEMLQLIRVRKQASDKVTTTDWPTRYKGAMEKQPLDKIDEQLTNLRNSWE
jgi:hypothetical protein